MNHITVTEIRSRLNLNGATLTKLKYKLNGQPAYRIDYADGSSVTKTLAGLKEMYVWSM